MWLSRREIDVEQEKPIYCWKVSDEGKIQKFVITRYYYDKWVGEARYIFYHSLGGKTETRKFVRKDNFDRYVHHTYYSFDENDKVAIDTILTDYKWTAADLTAKLVKINRIISEIEKENDYEKE